jgi:hypothetical protein
VNWIHLAKGRVQEEVVVNIIMNLEFYSSLLGWVGLDWVGWLVGQSVDYVLKLCYNISVLFLSHRCTHGWQNTTQRWNCYEHKVSLMTA